MYALSIRYMASGCGTISSRTLLSWYLPSVIKIKVGILPLKSSNVWILIAHLEYFPFAQANNLRLKETVVESSAKTSLSMSTFGIVLSEYMGLTVFIKYSPKSAKILQSLFSLALDSVD